MSIPNLGKAIDERFRTHRLRSTSTAGILCAVLALGLFEYHYYIDHYWSWDLIAVGATFVTVKLTLLLWYRLTD